MRAGDRQRKIEERVYTSWDRARLSVVVPIGVIVGVAILCIVVAVLSSAYRADRIAIDQERQLFTRALENRGERILREVESIASSPAAIANIRQAYDFAWIDNRLGSTLLGIFGHGYVFIFDGDDRPIPGLYAAGSAGRGGALLPGHGHSLGWAFTSGRIAGRNAAGMTPMS